jgi:hypothetical protein
MITEQIEENVLQEAVAQAIPEMYHVELTQKERMVVLHALNELPIKGKEGLALLLKLIQKMENSGVVDGG